MSENISSDSKARELFVATEHEQQIAVRKEESNNKTANRIGLLVDNIEIAEDFNYWPDDMEEAFEIKN